MTPEQIKDLAKQAGGTTYTNRHYLGESACAFGPDALVKFAQCIRQQALAEPARVPLTREQVNGLLCGAGYTEPQERADFINGLRHGEEAHGIKTVCFGPYDPEDDNK